MSETGYETQVFKGSVSEGVVIFDTEIGFGNELETVSPMPTGCAF